MLNRAASFCLLLVDADEIKRLGKRFKKLDLDNSGSLSVEEFMSLPELQQNPLVQRVIDIFDTDGNGEVDFKGKKVVLVKLQVRQSISSLTFLCTKMSEKLIFFLNVLEYWFSYNNRLLKLKSL